MKVRLNGNALTTVRDVAEFMGMEPGGLAQEEKNNLARMVNAYSDYIENATGRKFCRAQYVERHESAGNQKIVLREYPVVSVECIRDIRGGGEVSPDSYDWKQDRGNGVVFLDSGWPVRGYRSGLSGDFRLLSRYLEVSYTAGYILPKDASEKCPSDLPYDLQWAVWQMAKQQWELSRNGADGLSAFSISDISWTFNRETDPQVAEMLEKYRRYVY